MMHELIRCGYCDALLEDAHEEFAAHDAVCQANPLVKRIAELERQNAALIRCVTSLTYSTNLLSATIGLLRERVTELEAQLRAET